MKKFLSVLLSFALLAASVSISAQAAENKYNEVGSYSMTSSEGTYASGSSDNISVDAKAVETLRENMLGRQRSIKINVKVDSLEEDYLSEYVLKLADEATSHTGNPVEGDYLAFQMSGWESQMLVYTYGGIPYMTVKYLIDYFTTAEQEQEVSEKVDEILNSLSLDGKDDYWKVIAIYQYVCDNVEYDYSLVRDKGLAHSAYAALCKGTAVCQGYANALYRLLLTAGIDCRIISGFGSNEAHAWNIVKLGDKYYQLDSTWDSERNPYEYFLRGKLDFDNHIPDEKFIDVEFEAEYPIADYAFSPEAYYDNSDTDSTTDTDSDTESDTDTATDTDSDTDSDTDTATDTDSDTDSDTDTATDTSSDTDSDTDTTTDTNSDTDSDTDTATDTDSDTDSDTDTATDTDSDTDTDTDTTTDTNSDTDSDTDTTIDTSSDTDSDTDTTTDTGSDTDSDTDTATDTDSDTDTDTRKLGDLDGDDNVTSSDALSILRQVVGLETYDETMKRLADVDFDNEVTSADALEILRYVVGLSNNEKIGQILR